MESGTNRKKLKVVWLCHFANEEIKDIFKKPEVKEFAPWISNLIKLFQSETNLELHIVSPNVFNNESIILVKNQIYYHFYKYKSNIISERIRSIASAVLGSNYLCLKLRIVSIIKRISPDLIHLHGAENPYYSIGIFPFLKKLPVLITIQGFVRLSSYKDRSTLQRIIIEEKIIKKAKYFGTRTINMNDIIKQINPTANFYFHNYPLTKPFIIKDNIGVNEPIDCIYFARISKDKGVEDLLAAISKVKKRISSISVTIIGSASNKYLNYLKSLCSSYNIESNIHFLGYLPTQFDIYRYAYQAKVCILPTYYDIIPGTIIESMMMKLPVISYSVGGIPEINFRNENIVLVEPKNVKMLSEKIFDLIIDPNLRKVLSENAYLFAQDNYFNNFKMINDITNIYNSIISDSKPK